MEGMGLMTRVSRMYRFASKRNREEGQEEKEESL
jgi:hypothetical protein